MKKVPLRTCMGCNEKKQKKELLFTILKIHQLLVTLLYLVLLKVKHTLLVVLGNVSVFVTQVPKLLLKVSEPMVVNT